MYFLYEFDKASTTYNMPGVFELRGTVDIVQLESVFSQLINRHESLRTVFELADTGVVQRVLEDYDFRLAATPVEESEVEAAISEFVRPFDLSSELPIRIALLKVSSGLHLLLVDMHHIISDGISMNILLADFWSLYQGNDLGVLPLQYSEYAVWQQSEEHQIMVNEAKKYWQELYEEDVPELLLPYDNPRPLYRNDKGIVHHIVLSASQSDGLCKLSEDFEVTLSTIFLSLFKILLHKLSGSEDIVVGTATAGRHHADLEGMVGMFVNTLALRDRIFASDSLETIVSKVHQTVLSSMEHQLYQYEDLIDLLGLERNMSRNPLFDVSYLYAEQDPRTLSNEALALDIRPYNTKKRNRSKFDLSMQVSVSDAGISLGFVGREDLFEAASLDRFMNYLVTLVDQILLDASQRIADLSILSKSERETILSTFNDTVVKYNEQATVLDLFKSQINKNPEAIAVVHNGETLTYRELDARSDKWSNYLSGKGVDKGAIVGLLMRRSSEMVTAILSIFKLGCAYLPIDPDQPISRSLHMLSEMSSMGDNRLVLSNLSSVEEQISSNYEVLTTEDLDKHHGQLLTFEYPEPSDLAYIIYTSGSTGQPKGVLVEHGGITNLIQSQLSYFDITSDEKILQSSRYHFDPSVEQIWLALTSGSSLVLVDDEVLSNEKVFNRFLATEGITHLHNTPSFLGRMKLTPGLSLRRVIAGGEACSISIARHISSLYPFYNKYGLTEGTVTSTIHPVDFNELTESMTGLSIGRPIGNTQVYILDAQLNLVGEGIIGELYIGGKGLSRGYLNKEELTAARFIANPYGEGKLYKTGDLAKWNNDGTIQYLGRADQQLKYNGVRIEPGEIEGHICNLPGIKESVVTVKEVLGSASLVCYYVSDQAYTEGDLQSCLSTHLPVAMIPRYYVKLSEMPTTSTGKVDRKSLPEVGKQVVDYVPPKTVLEQQLLAHWAEILRLDESEIGTTHNFFDLGGNSLMAMVLINRINKDFAVQLLLRDIFQYQTIRSLANYINGLERHTFISIPKANKQESYPLSSAQQRMYFLYEFDKASTTYNMPGVFELRGTVDIVQLESVFSQLINRHESLRTVFELADTGVVQRVLEDYDFRLAATPVEESEVEAAISEFVRPFDLSSELPIRIALLKVSSGLHLLLVDMHHIISDGISMNILLADFWSLYQGNDLGVLPLQYSDYAVWQQSEEHQIMVNEAKKYWQELYEEDVPELLLPYDNPRPLYRNDKGIVHHIVLSASQSDGLCKLSEDFEVTLSTIFLSLFKILLHKLSGSEDIVVGTATAGRHHADLEGMVGMFVNTLALRDRIFASDSLETIVSKVHQTVLSSMEHQLYQYEDLIDLLGLERNMSRNPLFDVSYLYAEQDPRTLSNEALALDIRPYNTKKRNRSKFDLSMQVSVSDAGISLGFVGREDLFEAASLDRFMNYLVTLVDQILLDASQRIADLSILSKSERETILSTFNDTVVKYNEQATVLDLFKSQINKNPEAIAVVHNGETLTYRELDARSDKWSNYLSGKGVDKGAIVGLLMRRSSEMVTAILSIFKLGCAYLPIDPDQPISRSLHMLSEMSSMGDNRLVLSNLSSVEEQISSNYEVLTTEDLDKHHGQLLTFEYPEPSDLAYIIYTSGSTGQPKGVLVEHGGITNLIQSQLSYFDITSDEKILQSSRYHFDPSVEQIWLALTSGSSLVLVDDEVLSNEKVFNRFLATEGITHLHNTPSFLGRMKLTPGLSLRRVIAGGEACSISIARHISSLYPFYNKYGLTEGTVTSTIHPVDFNELTESMTGLSIGRPIGNTQVYILDAQLNLVGEGIIGELYIGGKGLSRGYLNKEELTAARFIANPYGEGKLYKTGDLAKWNNDGTIQYLGRADQQLKYNGVRIEPGEIEGHICNLPGIKESVVTIKEVLGSASLVCYYVSDQAYTEGDLQSCLSTHLPVAMIPRYYVKLSEMPTTSTGKVDRKSLPEVGKQVVDYVPPKTVLEQQLLAHWAEILRLDESEIGTTHNFFDLGGNSLMAMVLINRINKDFAVQLLLRDIFQYQTIRSLANYINGLERHTFISIPKANKQESYPLSSAQQRMYFLYEFDKASTTYNMPGVFELRGTVDIVQLESVFSQLINRHESLRTVFELADTGVVQRVLEDYDFRLAATPVEESEVEAAISEFVRPFDLSSELPIRIALLKVSSGLHLLLVDMHHIISDGISMNILLADFWSLYQGNDLGVLPLQYSDYAVWQQSEEHQIMVNEAKKYWQELYEEDVPELLLPYDNPRPLYRNDKGIVHHIVLSASQSDGLCKLSEDFEVTLSTIFLSLFKILLHKLSGSEDIVVGTATAGRHHADLEGMVGMFVNTLALRDRIFASDSLETIVSKVHQTVLSSMEHQLYQYEDLIDLLGLERNMSRNPLFDVSYLYAEQDPRTLSNEALALDIRPYNTKKRNRSKFDLSMQVSVSDAGISLGFVGREDLFEAASLDRFMNYLVTLVDQILLDASQRIADLSILSKSERETILSTFNDTVVKYNEQATVLDLFKSQINKNPEAIAVVHNGETLTYRELDARSDKWSNYLSGKGVDKGAIVGLLMRRSSEMVTAILSIFKLGCAYLPIDPDQPISRSLHMLSEMSSMGDNRLVLSNLSSVEEQISSNYEVLTTEDLDKHHGQLLTFEYPEPSDLAYIIYTSGSTGQPKGVLVEHGGITNLIQSQLSYFDITSDEKILQSSRYHFDPSVEQIWLALTSGSSLVLVDDEVLSNEKVFNRFLATEGITHLHNTPSFLGRMKLTPGLSLRRVIAGGEACSISIARHISSLYPFYNKYGLTEGTVTSTIHPVDFNELTESMTGLSIGRPIGNTQVYILDAQLNLVGEGIIGELYIGGKGLSRGYLNKEELTAARFIANPYGEGKLYKTGDLAKWNNDGTIQYLGRADQQLKYNGVRIEPGEIEGHICNLPGIKESVVTIKEVLGSASLVCYYVSDQAYTEGDLQSCLSTHLPVAMIPRYYVKLSEMPTTSTGKVDRKSLPEVGKQVVDYVPPKTVLEQQLLAHWAEILRLDESEIGTTHNFFDLGGNSLMAMVLINRINKDFAVQLLLRDIFQYQTIRSLANYINGLERHTFISIPKANKQESYPLSSAQQRMYFLYEFDKASTTYNMPGVFELRGTVDIVQLESVFSQLINRHESLRTVFELADTGVVQRVLEDYDFRLAATPVEESEVEAAISEFVRPFDLSSELPIRIALLKVSSGLHLLLVDMHHIISDGISMNILLADFWSLYQGNDLGVLPLQYSDYAVWQQSEEHQIMVNEAKKYWQELYEEDVPELLLPYDNPRPLYRNDKGIVHHIVLSASQSDGLCKLSEDFEVTLSTIFLSLFKILLHKLSGSEDIVVGTATAGRHHADLEGMVGMFVNTLALRDRIFASDSLETIVSKVHQTVLSSMEHQLYQYEDLIDLLGLERNMSRNPLFDVSYLYAEQDPRTLSNEALALDIRPYNTKKRNRSKFDLSMQVSVSDAGISLGFVGREDLFEAASLDRFMNYLVTLVDQILLDASQRIADLSILSKSERETILSTFNDTVVKYNEQATVLDLFKSQINKNPEAIAVVHNGETLTYRELDARSDKWSNYLSGKGVDKGAIVGLLMRRSSEMVTAILSIFKLGCAYLPIDPDQPISRSLHMLSEMSSMGDNRLVLSNLSSVEEQISSNYEVLTTEDLDKHHGQLLTFEYPEPSDLAYIIYTSGSTGQPKGVLVEHGGITNLIQSQLSYFDITSDEKILQSSRYHFDPSVEQIWLALTSGSSLVLVDDEVLSNEKVFNRFLATEGITHLHNTPSFLGRMKLTPGLSLRRVIAGGEACSISIARHISSLYPFYNKYGLTEGTVTSTIHPVDFNELTESMTGLSIGRPIGNTQVYILDAQLNLVGEGIIGELYIGGKGLSRGYLNKEELTAARFIANPYGEGKLYKTGDLAKWNNDGTIQYLGRADQQLKYNGVRIEPGEIEGHICNLPGLKKVL